MVVSYNVDRLKMKVEEVRKEASVRPSRSEGGRSENWKWQFKLNNVRARSAEGTGNWNA